MEVVFLILSVLVLVGLIICILLLLRLLKIQQLDNSGKLAEEIAKRQESSFANLKTELLTENRASRTETGGMVQTTMTAVSDTLTASINQQFRTFSEQNRSALEDIRISVNHQMALMRQENQDKLEQMRITVDEKLQRTLNERITQSFQLVSQQLQEVYSGLGEMKNLASGVGDLKKVLSNVRTRGMLGEYQLGAILQEILSPEQYEENVVTKKGSALRVEYAIHLPGADGHSVYLPIDAKFPSDAYGNLVDAYESADPERIQAARSVLEKRILDSAKDIHDKYIDPPGTTDFAILFLPFEGLYAEVIQMGMVETLQRKYQVNIAGPTTLAALLNSLQMGFRTLAIQKRSGEVWTLLGAVKTEFATFQNVLEAAQKRIEQTGAELDKLVGVRTRQINRKLKNVSAMPMEDAAKAIEEE